MKESQFKMPDSEVTSDEISIKQLIIIIKDWWNYLYSKWLIITIFGVMGGVLGVSYAYFQKWTYTAELSFALEDDKGSGGLGGALGLASQFGFDLGGSGGGAFAGDNLLVLMKSRSMFQKALLTTVEVNGKKQTLAELYIDYNDIRKGWEKVPKLKSVQFLPCTDPSKFTIEQDSILGVFHKSILKKELTVEKLDKKLSIIIVRVNSKSELFAKYFTEAITKEVSDFYVETKTKKSVENLRVLQHQTDSVRNELNLAIYGVATSVDINPNPNSSRQVLRVPSQRRQVDVVANQAILTELVKNLEVSKVSLRRETPLIQVIDYPVFPLDKDRLGKRVALIQGGFLGGLLIVGFLIVRRIIKSF